MKPFEWAIILILLAAVGLAAGWAYLSSSASSSAAPTTKDGRSKGDGRGNENTPNSGGSPKDGRSKGDGRSGNNNGGGTTIVNEASETNGWDTVTALALGASQTNNLWNFLSDAVD